MTWLPTQDTCELDKVCLQHLDGTVVVAEEYDRMQRFIWFWHKMGWSIDETDKALLGLSISSAQTDGGMGTEGDCGSVGFDIFEDTSRGNMKSQDGCSEEDDWNYPDTSQVVYEISPDFLQQVVAVRKLLDQSGLPLRKLLSFWADIRTVGEKSLYASLFLRHNLLGIDKVFRADMNGNDLTQSSKLTDHFAVLMTALNLKADDVSSIISFRQLPDSLTVSSVSVLYGHSLLAKILHVRVTDLPDVIALFSQSDPFKNAHQMLSLLENWGKMEDGGFTFRQLDYIILNNDEKLRLFGPTRKTILEITKTLYDGLNGIECDQPDGTNEDGATSGLVRTKAALLFERATVEQILGVLEGTTLYTTNARVNLTVTIPTALNKKLKYAIQKDANPPGAVIEVTGIFTADEQVQAKLFSSNAGWSKGIDRISKQTLNSFNNVLFGIFSGVADAKDVLLAGDVAPSTPTPGQQDATPPDLGTALVKRLYFLKYFMPFLRRRLTHRFVVDTISGATGLASDVTDVLLSNMVVIGSPAQSAMDALVELN